MKAAKWIRFQFSKSVHCRGTMVGFREYEMDTKEYKLTPNRTPAQALEEALDSAGLFDLEVMVFENGRLTGNRMENEAGWPHTPESMAECEARKEPMYLAQYDIYVTVYEVIPATYDDAGFQELFPEVKAYG